MEARFEEAFGKWLEKAKALVAAHYADYPLTKPTLEVEPGRRYIRIVKTDPGSRSSYCFIDTTNGDVLKAESWKKPAKGARGNIFIEGKEGVTPYGGHYIRR